jgi:hypothetical protein
MIGMNPRVLLHAFVITAGVVAVGEIGYNTQLLAPTI